MANKLLSLVIPAYNEPAYLAKAIESVHTQSYRPIELIISDDNSPVGLEEVAQRLLSLTLRGSYGAEVMLKFYKDSFYRMGEVA